MGGIERMNKRIFPVGNGVVPKPKDAGRQDDGSFKEVLESAHDRLAVNFSKHAMGRLNSRNISLDKGQVERLNLAVEKARSKGIRDTLILMDDKAFVVNVRNTTVITAADRDSIKERIFTNIDGAVII